MPNIEERYNLRDLGGCQTHDGRRLRRGLLFRSATIADMPQSDLEELAPLGIRLVIDLRSKAERSVAPAMHGIPTWASDREDSRADLSSAWRVPGLTAARATQLMLDVYRSLPEEQAASYSEMMGRIAKGELPLLFHCAAGKDRTGVASAILLDILGVPRPTIVADYLLTRRGNALAIAQTRTAMTRLGVENVDDSILEPVLGVNPIYLEAMFDEIERTYGTTEIYSSDRLGLSQTDLNAIRDRLLE